MKQCPLCNYSSKSTANLHRHFNVHRKTFFGNFRCSLCNYGSTRKENVIRHLARKHNNRGDVITGPPQRQAPIPYPQVMFVANFQCNKCKYSSTNEKDVMRHRIAAHNDQTVRLPKEEESPKSYPGPPPEPLPDPCPEQLASPDTQHKIVFAANFQCSACNYKSVKKEDVIMHQATKHGGEDEAIFQADSGGDPSKMIYKGIFQCSICNFKSYNRQIITRHKFEKHGLRDEEFAAGRRKKTNEAKAEGKNHLEIKSAKVEDEDESEPAKRLLLAECGLIWHSDVSIKNKSSVDDFES